MLRREFLKFGALTCLANVGRASPKEHNSFDFTAFGRTALFASHRFQYCEGRNFQIILRLRSPQPGRKLALGKSQGPLHFSVANIDLRRLRPGNRERLRSVDVRWNGSAGKRLPGQLHIIETLFYSEVLQQQARSPGAEYYVFGTAREAYASHILGGAPDFEHLIRLPAHGEFQTGQMPNTLDAARKLVAPRDVLFERMISGDC